MQLSKLQNRYIQNKNIGYTILKGKEGTGKSTASIYRALNLENNYLINSEDRILYISANKHKKAIVANFYKELKDRHNFYSLFSVDHSRVDFYSIDEYIATLSKDTNPNLYNGKKTISKSEALKLINSKDFINELFNISKVSKPISKMSLEQILDEILWIKASNLSLEEYLEVERKNRKPIFYKGSTSRQSIYLLKEIYNKELSKNNLSDSYDNLLLLLNEPKGLNSYCHIILDDIEDYTKSEIDLFKSLYNNRLENSITFIINNKDATSKDYTWFTKGRNIKSIVNNFKVKSFIFKTSFIKDELKDTDYMEKYKYINLKNKNITDFKIDTFNTKKELYTSTDITYIEEELQELPIYNEIAAGNPSEINENLLGSFNVPKGWLERGKDSFILGVKGNSMIDKDICNGDYVVVKRQTTANNNDIVAATVDGDATLKTLKLDKEEPMLLPANKAYSPIYIKNREVCILGVVIGIIKNI